jgi:hypothetical protein
MPGKPDGPAQTAATERLGAGRTGDAGHVASLAMCDFSVRGLTHRWSMGQRIEVFLADVLALAGEDLNAIRAGVRNALADCEAIFRATGAEQAHEG